MTITKVLPVTDTTIARDRLALGAPGPRMPQADALFKSQLQRLVKIIDRFEQHYSATLVRDRLTPDVPSC